MKFHKNSLKLAGVYLAILMVISLFFSINVYQLSVQELGRGLRRPAQGSVIDRLPGNAPDRVRSELLREREEQYQLAKSRIINRLILVNSIILIGGGLLSYYFALRTLKPIEKAHDAQSRFTADASHELRTPITVMQAETEVALMDPKLTLPKAKAILRSNIEELAKLTTLSEALLRLAQAENTELATTTVNITKVAHEASKRVKSLARKKDIDLHISAPETVNMKAEESSLQEVFAIILDNAIKYSPKKSTIKISVAEENKLVKISVQDNGVGMSEDELLHVFDRFYRADSARSKQVVSGYGLGLAIAKNIVDMHHGKIEVSSKKENGTTFTVYLPK